jgi:dCMP deaminase
MSAPVSWDDYALDLARLVASKSKDPSTQCGCVLLDAQHRVVSTGYNGFPRGVADDAARLQDRDTKLALVIHAEENALLFAQRDLTGCTAYVWPMPPCSRCAAKLAQVGIVRVVTVAPTAAQRARWGESFDLAQWVYAQVGLQYEERPVS